MKGPVEEYTGTEVVRSSTAELLTAFYEREENVNRAVVETAGFRWAGIESWENEKKFFLL